MDLPSLRSRIAEIITPFVEEECLVLVEVRLSRSSEGMRLVLLVDRPHGGITVATCALLNGRIGEAIDGHEVFAGPYTLEVSSPGVDRELITGADFERCLQRRVRVFLAEPVEGKLEWDGTITAADRQSVMLQVKDRIVNIDLEKVHTARQIL